MRGVCQGVLRRLRRRTGLRKETTEENEARVECEGRFGVIHARAVWDMLALIPRYP
jgi:hypothetical protein